MAEVQLPNFNSMSLKQREHWIGYHKDRIPPNQQAQIKNIYAVPETSLKHKRQLSDYFRAVFIEKNSDDSTDPTQ